LISGLPVPLPRSLPTHFNLFMCSLTVSRVVSQIFSTSRTCSTLALVDALPYSSPVRVFLVPSRGANVVFCFVGQGWPFQRSVRLMLLPPLPYPIAGFTYCSTPLTPTTSPADGADVAAGQAPLPPGHSFLLSGEVC
jgi:hypothetical protein